MGLNSVAFPGISAGVYGYPQREAIKVAVETMKKYAEEFEELTLVLFGEHSVQVTVQSLLDEFAEGF